MRFSELEITKKLRDLKGIKEIKLQRLKTVVALVGRNGSGKTRILDLIEESFMKEFPIQMLFTDKFSHFPNSLETIKNALMPYKEFFLRQSTISELTKTLKSEPTNSILKQQLNTLNRIHARESQTMNSNSELSVNINKAVQLFSQIVPLIKQKYFRRINGNEVKELQKAISITNNESLTSFEDLLENVAENINYDELKSINRSALTYLFKLPHMLTSQKVESLLDETDFEDKLAYKRFLSLEKFIKAFLKKTLTWERKTVNNEATVEGVNVNYSGIWKLDGREFNYSELSDGEKFLFAYALLFFLLDQNPQLNIKESIIVLDEPELHLHPASEIDLIEGISEIINKKGQLIIATHSLSILSHLNYEEIFMVKDGTVKHPSQSTPGESLNELMELDIRIYKLSNFLSSISNWTFSNFMAQCFSKPEVIESARPNDPQVLSLKKAITEKSTKSSNMLLDFGAGKGRLIEQIKADYDFMDKINYSALEPEETYHDNLTKLGVAQIYKSSNEIPANNFDFVVLCNVLHEIDIDKWLSSINSIINSLKDTGYLIIIEAKVLAKGEKIGKIGYLVLDIEEMKELFNLKETPSSIKIEGSENLITCAIFPKDKLSNVTNQNLLNCFSALENNTLLKIQKLREQDHTNDQLVSYGRLSAFLSQQYINSKFAKTHIEEISS